MADFYIQREKKLLRGFDRVAKRARKSLEGLYGKEFAQEAISRARQEFTDLIPQLPYVGGPDNLARPIVVINGWIVGFYRAMLSMDKTAQDTARVACDVSDSYFRPLPGPVLRFIGRLGFGRGFRWLLQLQARRSRKRRYEEDWVFEVKKGDGKDFDLALVMEECAVQKIYQQFDAMELAPYCCLFDLTYSRYMNMGLNASKSMGLGHETCTLAYKKGRETKIPQPLADVMPKMR